MKITDVRACQPRCASPPDWRTSLGQILVAIDTDVGLTGYGVGGGGLSALHIVHTVLRDLLLGRDAGPVEELWEEMYRATLPFGRKGVAIMALSGVDLALWDLRGKAERKSVAALLAASCPLPIAGGEHEFTTAAFAELMERRLHAVLQPDVCWCGGMTQLVRIYELAHVHGLRVCSHRGAEVWALHALAALDPQPLAESGRPWLTWVRGQPPIRDGFIRLTDAPGFGAEIAL